MRKYITLISIILLFFCTAVFATPPPIPSIGAQSEIKTNASDTDTQPYHTVDTAIVTTKGYSNLRILANVTGTGPDFSLIPMYTNDTGVWYAGTSIDDVTWDTGTSVETFGVKTMSIMIQNQKGSSAHSITIKVYPYNK